MPEDAVRRSPSRDGLLRDMAAELHRPEIDDGFQQAVFRSVGKKTAEVFDLPGDVVAGLPRVELLGDRQLRMENHRGILAYGSDEIHISGGKLIVKVRGTNLELRAMNAVELLITGDITGVDLA